jgi:hypothetical protein
MMILSGTVFHHVWKFVWASPWNWIRILGSPTPNRWAWVQRLHSAGDC